MGWCWWKSHNTTGSSYNEFACEHIPWVEPNTPSKLSN
nr:MAG TPA: hypothetical protein [Caudoviricetes sp.]